MNVNKKSIYKIVVSWTIAVCLSGMLSSCAPKAEQQEENTAVQMTSVMQETTTEDVHPATDYLDDETFAEVIVTPKDHTIEDIIAIGEVKIPDYAGNIYEEINENMPFFMDQELAYEPFENYSELDELGRAGSAFSMISYDMMPTEKNPGTGDAKPSGWNQNKYEGVVDSQPPYLYNRCHLIGYQLTGQTANEKNLITGTRFFNVEGMLPFENQVGDYIRSTGNSVLYRVTPIYYESNLVAKGVLMEAQSIQDDELLFCVFVYNVQPGVIIDYKDGSNSLDPDYAVENTTESQSEKKTEESTSEGTSGCDYILNTNSHKFHYPTCRSVRDMAEHNKQEYTGSREEVINMGYDPCGNCRP